MSSPATPPRSVVTFGVFDGVHRGHQALIGEVTKRARERGLDALALTFDPPPVRLHRPALAPPLLCSVHDRVDFLMDLGLSRACVVPYTPEFAAQTAEAFARDVLVGQYGAAVVVLGQDARFGAGNRGDVAELRELGKQYGFEVVALGGVGDDGASERWSSSKIRAALAAGDVAEAARLLGRNHLLRGVVVHGDARGRTLGFPTANLGEISGLIPADGVYAGYLIRADREALSAAISIGTNPTFDGEQRRVEAYVLDRTDLELYDERVSFEFVARIRGTVKFGSADELVEKMHDDVAQVRRVLDA